MSSLKSFLKEKNYKALKMSSTETNHYECKVTINGVEGSFIIDTGASSSCIDFTYAHHFNLFSEDSNIKAAGAGATNMLTRASTNNKVAIGKWTKKKVDLILFDLSHVNKALSDHDAELVHGIIGADILKRGKAVIDYKTDYLYLK
ncbi:MAG: retropepsin-like aspartic protease [Psychroflexus sp.]